MAKRKEPSKIPAKKISIAAVILIVGFAILVLLNQAMGGILPLPTAQELDTVLGSLVDELYGQAGVAPSAVTVDGDLVVHFIDVGQGDCELIQGPEKTVLIDAGEAEQADVVSAYLRAQGITTIDILIATHPHADHIGGLYKIVEEFEVKTILFPELPDALIPTTRAYERLLDTIDAQGLKINHAVPGKKYDLGDGAEMTILAPLFQYTDDLNELSVVCRVDFGNTSFMFTGDASKQSENDMVEKYGSRLSATVLNLGHHGSKTASQDKWLSAVSPQIAVASLAYDNDYGHPHPQVLKRLEKHGIPLYRTDQHGTIVISSDGEHLDIVTEKAA